MFKRCKLLAPEFPRPSRPVPLVIYPSAFFALKRAGNYPLHTPPLALIVQFLQIQIPTDRASGTRTCATPMLTNKFVEICSTPLTTAPRRLKTLGGIHKVRRHRWGVTGGHTIRVHPI